MRASGAVAVGTVAAACAAAALAGPPWVEEVRDCRTRAETGRPVSPTVARRGFRVGPLRIQGAIELARAGSPTTDPNWPFAVKAPVVLPARTKVVLAVAPTAASLASFQSARQRRYVSSVRFEACREREPAWTYRGTVGGYTAFAFAIGLARRAACVPVEVWIDGRADPIRRVVPVGRRAC